MGAGDEIMIIQIVAVDEKYGIGKKGRIPWPSIKEDMRLFRTMTTGHEVVMGRKTMNSLPDRKALKNRTNCVLSNTTSKEELEKDSFYLVTLKDVRIWMKKHRPVYIIGGASLYKEFGEDSNFIYMSRIPGNYDCDVFYPKENLLNYDLVDTIKYSEFDLEIYRNKQNYMLHD